MKGKQLSILISLDAIYDTALGVYKRHLTEDTLGVVLQDWGNPKRAIMWNDTYPMAKDDFIKAWADRSIEDLKVSDVTPLADLIAASVKQFNNDITNNGDKITLAILNTHPYELSEKEQEVMRRLIGQALDLPVNSIHKPKLSIYPMFLKSSGIVDWYDVDMDEWFATYITKAMDNDNFKMAPEVNLNMPAILRANEWDSFVLAGRSVNMAAYKGRNVFDVRSETFAPLIAADYITPTVYTSTIAVKTYNTANAIKATL